MMDVNRPYIFHEKGVDKRKTPIALFNTCTLSCFANEHYTTLTMLKEKRLLMVFQLKQI